MSTKKTLKFADRVLAELNKDEAAVQKDNVNDIVEDYKIQCQTQIGFIKTGTIPKLVLTENQEKRKLATAKKELASSYTNLAKGDFENYIALITKAEKSVEDAENVLSGIKSEIASAKTQVEKFESLLTKLQS